MTGQPQPHPLRCETCKHKLPDCDREALGSRVCKKIFLEDPRALQIGIPYFIDIVGCASHSSAGSQQRIEQVIGELVDLEAKSLSTCDTAFGYREGLKTAIAILREGAK